MEQSSAASSPNLSWMKLQGRGIEGFAAFIFTDLDLNLPVFTLFMKPAGAAKLALPKIISTTWFESAFGNTFPLKLSGLRARGVLETTAQRKEGFWDGAL